MDRAFTELFSLYKSPRGPISDLREPGLTALVDALNSVLPGVLIPQVVRLEGDTLYVANSDAHLAFPGISKALIVGGGKATAQMAEALVKVLQGHIAFEGIVNIPHEQKSPPEFRSADGTSVVRVNFSSHPVPDEAGQRGVEEMGRLVREAGEETLVFALISGGGSALMPAPAPGLSLSDKQLTSRLLLQCGADIKEINTVRKHLSTFKGGQLARWVHPRTLVAFILSDVVGNDLQAICSGPTVPDLFDCVCPALTRDRPDHLCRRTRDLHQLPEAVRKRLEAGKAGSVPETPKPGDTCFSRTHNLIVGSAELAAQVAVQTLQKVGFRAFVYSDSLSGEARDYGKALFHSILPELIAAHPQRPSAFIATGEFTVTLKGKGKGGRNQEMLLAFLMELEAAQRQQNQTTDSAWWRTCDFCIISAAFDGIEGNSECMGALVDSRTIARVAEVGLDLSAALANNNSNAIFKALCDELRPGYTGTNVNDMTMILLSQKPIS